MPKTQRIKNTLPKIYLANIPDQIPKTKVLYSLNNEYSQILK